MTVGTAISPHSAQQWASGRRGYRLPLSLAMFTTVMLANGWVTAAAQDIPPMGPTTPVTGQGQGGQSHAPIGTVPQPTLNDPGWVMGITLGELYTDNLKLAGPGERKRSSWITQIKPFVKAAYSGPRFSGLLDYSLAGYLYAGQSHDRQLTQNLDAQGTFTVLPEHLFINGTAMYGSEIINNRLPYSNSTFFLDSNRANVARGTVSPYWTQELGNIATMLLRYTRGRVVYNTRGIPAESAGVLSGISNVKSNALQFSLASPKGRIWGWNLQYSNQRIKQDHAATSLDYQFAEFGMYAGLTSSYRFLANAGKENKFLPDGTVDRLGAGFWEVGLSWRDGMNALKAMVGHHFYGRTYQFLWVHAASLLTTTLAYEERPTDLNQQLLGQNPGQLVVSPIATSILPSLLERRIYLMKRATVSANYLMPRGKLKMRFYDERRTYFSLGNQQEKVANANVDWMFELGAFTTLTPTLGWQRYQFLDGQVYHTIYGQLALVHQLGRRDYASVKLRHDSRTVASNSTGIHPYGVNVVFVQWTHLF